MFRQVGAVCIALLLGATTVAQNKIEILNREVRLVNQQGNPVEGAFIDCWLINERYFWPENLVPRAPLKTDNQGIAKFSYPKELAITGSLLVESVKLSTSHPDYEGREVVVPVLNENKKPFEIRLEQGTELRISAIDEHGKPVTRPYAVTITKEGLYSRWNRPSPDVATSRGIKDGMHQIMLVQPDPDGHHLFSDVQVQLFNKATKPTVELKDVELLPGAVVKGTLAPEVPRPVRNGYVVSVSVPLPAKDSWDDKNPSLLYYDSADIDQDGSFHFRSLPSTGTLQLIAICDGWVGKQDKKSPFIVGETFDVDGDLTDIQLEMQSTFEARIRVVSEEGEPVEGVRVGCSPNQRFDKGGSTFLGSRPNSINSLRSQLMPEPSQFEMHWKENQYSAVSDENGQLTIRNLPRGRWSANFSAWTDNDSKTKIEFQERLIGQLPPKGEDVVEFDLKIKVKND